MGEQGSSTVSPTGYEIEIDLRALFESLWSAKWGILACGLGAALISVVYALSLPNKYEASMLLSPAQNSAGSVSSRLSGLATMAGVNIGGGRDEVNPTVVAVETLKSRRFLIDFIKRRNLAPEIAAATSYDREVGQWRFNNERYDQKSGRWLKQPPDDWELYSALSNSLQVGIKDTNGLVSLRLTSYSPEAAAKWLGWLVEDLNQHLMEKEALEAERSIAYLKTKLDETALTEMRQVFYQLIEQQTRTIMLAKAKPEYALSVIDPAMEPVSRSSPKRSLIVALGIMLGMMLAFGFVAARYCMRHLFNELNSAP